MYLTKFKTFKFSLLAFSLLLLINCKVALAPQYDAIITENLNESSTKTLTFFASIADGTDDRDYIIREPSYNTLIGVFETLELQARARPVPNNKTTEKINAALNAREKPNLDSDYPSAFAFKRIADNLKKMKEKDRESGLKPLAIQAFKGEILIFLDQAFTYESFLKR